MLWYAIMFASGMFTGSILLVIAWHAMLPDEPPEEKASQEAATN